MEDVSELRLFELRHAALLRSGFPEELAESLARRTDIDYLDALTALQQGLPPKEAAELLLAGSRPFD